MEVWCMYWNAAGSTGRPGHREPLRVWFQKLPEVGDKLNLFSVVGLCPSCLKLWPWVLGRPTGTQVSSKTNGEYLSTIPDSLGFWIEHFHFLCSPNHENCPRTYFPGLTQGLAQLGNWSVVMWFVLVISQYGAAFKEKCCFSNLGCCSFSHLLFSVLIHAFHCSFYENYFICEFTPFC